MHSPIDTEELYDFWDMETDVIVVGGGGAGLWAAIEASEAGSEVILLEKMPEVGGSTALCGGALAFAGTDLQIEMGIEDSNELLIRDLLEVGGHINDRRLMEAYAAHQLDTYRRLREFGVSFRGVTTMAGMSVPRAHLTDPAKVINILTEEAGKRGVRILTRCPARRLLVRGELDEITVIGVQAEQAGMTIAIRARQGVVLASGGFARSEQLMKKFAPNLLGAIVASAPGNEGDGLKMASAVGADIEDVIYVKPTFGLYAGEKNRSLDHRALFVYHGAILVNREGKRFINESLSYKLLGEATLEQPGKYGYQIFDARIAEDAEKALKPFRRFHELGILEEAVTIHQLGQILGMDPDQLCETVDRYNDYAKNGEDPEFGRKTLAHNHGRIVPIEEPPFYAFQTTAFLPATYGGITITPRCQVRNIFDEPIKRLYAAGEVVGGFHGQAYMSGTGFGKACVFGRIAGMEVAKEPRV